ncbi:MAG: threonine synthase [Haloferacaceae archaeon]
MTELTCYACGATAELGTAARCDCGEPLWLDTDPSGFSWASARGERMWRYGDLLPDFLAREDGRVVPPTGVGSAAGGTPLVRARRLDDVAGVRVHVKDEGRNPTGSFKDRGSALGVEYARLTGVERVGTVSHGNMAMSVAAHAASAGMDCVVLVPADISAERLRNIAQYDPTVVRVDGDYGRLYERSLELGREHGVQFVNSDAPLRVEGQKTTAVEVCEAFAPEGPDALVLPVSAGGHASGAWKAVRELREAGALDRVPRLYFVQTAAVGPIAEADARGDDEVTPVEDAETVAYSIANADPPSGNRALAAARDTGGAVVAVDDEEILEAKRELASRAGLSVESASATTLAGARRLADEDELRAAEDVVLVATGSGFKESGTGLAEPEPATVALDDLGDHLAAL